MAPMAFTTASDSSAASDTSGRLKSAASISMVLRGWLATLMTSARFPSSEGANSEPAAIEDAVACGGSTGTG